MWVLLPGSASVQGVTFWVPTHAPKPLVTHFESVSTFLSYPAPSCPWAWPFSWVVTIPRSSLGRHGHFTSQIVLHWRYYFGFEATFLFSLLLPRVIGVWGLPTASLPPWSFLPMGIGEQHCDCLAFVTLYLGDALPWPALGDVLSWRRFLLATLALGLRWLWPRRWLWLWLVNAWVRDGTRSMKCRSGSANSLCRWRFED